MNKYFNITISWRFALAATLPLILVATILTAFLVQARHQDSQRQFEETSEISTRYLGSSVELELYAGNTQELNKTANMPAFPNLVGVSFLNKDRQLITSTAGFQVPDELINLRFREKFEHKQLNRLYLQQEVHLTEIDVNDYADDSSEPLRVGWVITSFDTADIHQQQQRIVMTGISLGAAGLILAAMLALILGRTIVTPIHQLTKTVKHMEAGDLNARANQASTQELTRLAQGINLLAKSVADGRSNLEGKVRKATQTMEQALADLREKNSELQQARETAEAANHAKSDFLARMSHELRTPITAIQGFTRLLHSTELGDAERNYCTIINQSSNQLLNLIDDILAISRLQANAIEIASEPFNLIETLEQSVRQQALPARDKKLELILDISPEVPSTVVGDHFRVAQIVINLITNAVKFTNTGHVRTLASATPKDNEYTELTIEISDTGIGIPPQNLDHLFHPFSQADTSITRKYGGTGLGLSIVQSLLQLMGGTVNLDSSEGIGTLFRITLPMPITAVENDPSNIEARIGLLDHHHLSRQAVTNSLCRFVAELVVVNGPEILPEMTLDAVIVSLPSDAENEANYQYLDDIRRLTKAPLLVLSADPEACRQQYCNLPPQALKILDKPATQLSLHSALQQLVCGNPVAHEDIAMGHNLLNGLNVLIAEDNPFTREFLKTLLSREGAYCVAACNGIEAVAACDREPFDIMLIDIHMPEKSGIETVASIRNSDKDNRTAPIITITADVLQQEKLALKDAGITELLFKPVDEELLIKRILHHCKPNSKTPVLHRNLRDEIPVDQFLSEIDRLINLASLACRNDDLESARDPVHQLLGVAGVFKLPKLEVKVANLHKAIKNHRHSQAITALEELEQEYKGLAKTMSTA